MNKFIKVHPKANLKIYILIGIIQAISLTKLIISIINYSKISNKINNFEENDPDIIITGLSSIQFLEKKNPEEYNISEPNLGSTGKIILDCFSGECNFRESSTCYKTVCKSSNKKSSCKTEAYECYKDFSKLIYECSNECRTKRGLSCNSCPNSARSQKGSCSRNENDDYDYQKSCLADNVIYNWKGHYYDGINGTSFYGELSYLKNAVQANESCPTSMKMCGILDELGNKLCIPKTKDCPINYIKLSNDSLDKKYNYSFSNIGNKSLIYTNEAVSNKIIGGLYVDSDLLIQYNEKDCEILDTGNINELINENKILYKNVLNFDPYSEANINDKGKSYLKWCIAGQGRNKDLNIMKKENISFSLNQTINNYSINRILGNNSSNLIFSILGTIFQSIFFIIFLFVFFTLNKVGYNLCCSTNETRLIIILCISFFLFFLSSIGFNLATIINSFFNIDYLNKMKEANISSIDSFLDSLISINRTYFWINIIMYIIIILLIIYLYIAPKDYDLVDYNTKNSQTGNSDFPNFNINNTSTNNNNNNNYPYYNMDNNNNPNYANAGYNSSDYNKPNY